MLKHHILFALVFSFVARFVTAQPVSDGGTSNTAVSLSLETQPVVGHPLWVDVKPLEKSVPEIRYPFNVSPRDFGISSFEVLNDGQPVEPIGQGELLPYNGSGLWGGSAAPPSARRGRLPLHAAYRLTSPGHYSIRLRMSELYPRRELIISDWLDFDLTASSEIDPQLRALLNTTSTDSGELVGNLLPSLLGYSGEPVVRKIASYVNHPDRLVREFAMQSLSYYGEDVLRREVLRALRSGGPTEEMGYLISWKRKLFSGSYREIALAAIGALGQNPSAALTTLRFLRFGPDPTTDPELNSLMDSKVRSASDKIIASEDETALNALASFAGGAPDPKWYGVLRRLADRGKGREQALIALAWHGDEKNLPFLWERLLAGDYAASSLPYQLIRHYGKRGEDYVNKAFRQSRSMAIRWACARELTLLGRPVAFQFYLENLNQGRRREILQLMRDYMPGGRNLTDEQLPDFLKKQIDSRK